MNLAVAAKRHLPIAIGAAALVMGGALASASSADAADHGSQIKNYPLKQIDIAKAGVSGSHGAGNSEVEHQSVAQLDIGKAGVSGHDGSGGSEIEKGSVGVDDLSQKAKGALKGEQGPAGPKGDKGEPGEDGVSGYYVKNMTVKVAAGESASADVQCEEGTYATGGGVTAPDSTRGYGSEADLVTNVSGPIFGELPDGGNGATGWHTVVTNNNSDHDLAYLAWVQCAKVS